METGGEAVNRILFFAFLASSIVCSGAPAQTRKAILDQDGRGPATTDQQALLVMLQSPEIETLI